MQHAETIVAALAERVQWLERWKTAAEAHLAELDRIREEMEAAREAIAGEPEAAAEARLVGVVLLVLARLRHDNGLLRARLAELVDLPLREVEAGHAEAADRAPL